MTLLEKFSVLKEQLDAANVKLNEVARQAFEEGARDIFARYALLTEFSWTQYTPFFNDGEPCEFEVNNDYFEFEYDGKDLDYSDYRATAAIAEGKATEVDLLGKDIKALMDKFSPEHYKIMFGDHSTVSVRSDGILVGDYDHD